MIWVVRDLDVRAAPYVSVWSERPKRWGLGAGSVWLSAAHDRGNSLRGWLGSLWLADAWLVLGTVPDDDRQVVVMERDPAWMRKQIDRANQFRVPKPKDVA